MYKYIGIYIYNRGMTISHMRHRQYVQDAYHSRLLFKMNFFSYYIIGQSILTYFAKLCIILIVLISKYYKIQKLQNFTKNDKPTQQEKKKTIFNI